MASPALTTPDAYRAPRSILISLFFAPHPVRIFRRSSIDAPRRGRRPRRPVARSFHVSGEEYSALPGAGHFWPQRPDNLFLYAAGGHISFNSERNMEKNAAKNQRFLDFPCPIPTTVQKGSASNRLYPHPRCRSHAPRGDAPVCYRAAGLLRPYRRFPEYRRSSIDAPRRGRRPDGPLMFPPCPRRGEFRAAQARSPHPGKKEDHPQGGPPFYAFCRRAAFLTPS